ncbi:fumarylacetoacetate hydrolase family protein [Rhodococcoides fascians]|uniref:fumarylacetoacetate hydrolase family protein n=1 Tax=Rhodococcoides fascians TaxID=1828 RepID=UPI00050BE0D7|nr:fumarylacetoacetate hydrolase family protein [Rhodococcus fascians]MDQ0283400.1 2-keto-4-pentenoate hydratase/2-oxohepta-3-ene-1,7-dioic acid hydratase in catechol pathway [Rhodococcus fascians]
MRFVTYDGGGGPRTGIIDGETVRGLRAGVSLLSILNSGDDALTEAGEAATRCPDETRELDQVRLLAPIPRPPSVRDGLCFLDHLRGCYRAMGRSPELHEAWSQIPAFYFSNAGCVLGPYEDVPVAPGSTMFDLELEVGAVIGRGGRDLDPRTAEKHIVGYTLFNDWTARDHQLRDLALGIGMGKSKDSALTLGPALVTVDELEDYRRDGRIAIELSAAVNGDAITRGNLGEMDWEFGELVAFVSRGVDLQPGEVVRSGTVPGGCLLEHVDTPELDDFDRWLRPGDVVTLTGQGLGEVRQTVVPGVDVLPLSSGF